MTVLGTDVEPAGIGRAVQVRGELAQLRTDKARARALELLHSLDQHRAEVVAIEDQLSAAEHTASRLRYDTAARLRTAAQHSQPGEDPEIGEAPQP